MAVPGASFLSTTLLEPILLRGAARRSRALDDAARLRMRPWVQAARTRYRVARELRDAETQRVALGLLREAAYFALSALLLARPDVSGGPRSVEATWSEFATRPEALLAPKGWERVQAAFATEDHWALESLPTAEADALRPAAEAAVAWLLDLAEVRSPRRVVLERALRLVVAVALLGFTAYALIAYWSNVKALAE